MFHTRNPLPFHSYINNTFQFLFLIDTQINKMSRIHIKLYAWYNPVSFNNNLNVF